MTKKWPNNYSCTCGHLFEQHSGYDALDAVYLYACMVRGEDKMSFTCPHCLHFKPDNVRYLETLYAKKKTKNIR